MFEKGKNREEKIDKFLDNAGWYLSEKSIPTGLFSTIGDIRNNLVELNKNLNESNNSSSKLTRALNKITLFGVIIAGLGVLVALGNLVLDLLKYIKL